MSSLFPPLPQSPLFWHCCGLTALPSGLIFFVSPPPRTATNHPANAPPSHSMFPIPLLGMSFDGVSPIA